MFVLKSAAHRLFTAHYAWLLVLRAYWDFRHLCERFGTQESSALLCWVFGISLQLWHACRLYEFLSASQEALRQQQSSRL